MRILVLGPQALAHDDRVVELTSRRRRALLAALVVAEGRTVSADALIEQVWPDSSPADPANALQHAVAQLRKEVEPGRGPGDDPRVLLTEPGGYRLSVADEDIDARRFDAGVRSARDALARGAAREARDVATEALALWRGAPFSGVDDAGPIAAERNRLVELRAEALDLRLAARAEIEGPAAVAADAEAIAHAHPHREGGWMRLMTVLYGAGRQADALAAYRDAGRALREIGLEPSPRLRELEARVLRHDPSLGGGAPSAPGNLPTPVSTLIGRSEALASVADALAASRIVTLTGAAGIGKTRLAVEAGHRERPRHPDGVWSIRLDDVTDPALVVGVVAEALAMREDPGRDAEDALVAFLAGRRTLLILDNCEHIVAAVARLAAGVLRRCPEVSILATSREALRIDGERRIEVPPLALPDDAALPFSPLEDVPAVRLFLERARAVDPTLERSDDVLAAAANIVRRLDGMPLGIELAAARVGVMSPAELAVRLDDGLDALVSDRRDVPERQRTLRAAIAWTTSELAPADRRLLACLSVCAGGFDLDSVASVGGADPDDAERTLGVLRDRSLVVRLPDVGGRRRFRLLEPIRRHAEELLLESGESGRARGRHLAMVAASIATLDARLRTGDQLRAMAELRSGDDATRAALAWSLDGGALADGVAIAGRLGRYWDWRGALAEATLWTGRLLASEGVEDTPDAPLVHAWAAFFALELGDDTGASAHIARGLSLARARGDRHREAGVRSVAALRSRFGGDLHDAEIHNRAARRLALATDDPWLAAWATNHAALIALDGGDPSAAERLAGESLVTFDELGDERARGWALTVLAQVGVRRGADSDAAATAAHALALATRVGDERNAAWAAELGAAAARGRGDAAAAEALERRAAELRDRRGMRSSPWRHAHGLADGAEDAP